MDSTSRGDIMEPITPGETVDATDPRLPALYKIVGTSGECLNGGSGTWPLPTATEPGEWWDLTPYPEGSEALIRPCIYGLHLTDADRLESWLPSDRTRAIVYRAEVSGPVQNAGQKWVALKVRLLPRGDVADLVKARARRDRLVKRADNAHARAVKGIPPAILKYARAARFMTAKLPEPMATYRDRLVAADNAYHAALDAAQRDYLRASLPNVLIPAEVK